ncbi:hypothetical protein A1O7_01530 [Cladophialophora yegresii CBS 114405]|uniref:Xylanolytic transcriptional activator regulatory domain-containing protein n=1 Tax=Cladophialophora yegresii CBS 114405 TaxID=1182544 RepID=W9WJN2_9EURO|nr:uncharacterized protein A1O7_01530 [Cladophialophora yegresii CBS 114405]EXJ65190.1 hypothetical protein A1O7_01530 [Cladophialophora yegresii CBS 114405]
MQQVHCIRGPSLAYAISLEKRLQAFEDRFERLCLSTSTEEREALIPKPFERIKPERARRASVDTRQPKDRLDEGEDVDATESPPLIQRESPDEASVGVDGRICFYGKTSHYHVDLRGDEDDEGMAEQGGRHTTDQYQHISTASTIYTTPDINALTYSPGPPEVLSEIPNEFLDHLLDAYWCWAHHLHLVLNRRLFLRDLFVCGPWVTPFLICAVLAQAARYSTRLESPSLGNHFAARALQLLPNDIDRGSSIPTIQGLLILSARECGCGRTSQGWLYSGMAFRMMRDLGIHIDSKQMSYLARQFSEEELALRLQVFWSCFTWDKTMSLCLGRAPIIHDTLDLPSKDTLIDGQVTDDEPWRPVLGQEQESMAAFTEQKSLGSARFRAYCKLCVIIDGVLGSLYCRPHQSKQDHLLAFLENTIQKLEDWSSTLPDGLFVSIGDRAVLCPPIHILLLNMTYHATMILLCRPYRTLSRRARDLCTTAAQMIDSLFTLHVRRFGFRFITYLQTYTMFVACTINVLDLKENESSSRSNSNGFVLAQEASVRLNFGLEVLRQAGATPSAARCAAVILQLLRQWSDKKVVRGAIQSSRDHRGHGIVASPLPKLPSSSYELSAGVAIELATGPAQTSGSSPSHAPPASDSLPVWTPEIGSSNPQFHASLSSAKQPQVHGQTSNKAPSLNVPNSTAYQYDGHARLQQLGPNGSPYTNPSMSDFVDTGIETPMRWLPDNIVDDGSWMLMTDFGNGFLEV